MNELRDTTSAPVLEIAVPAYNEERVLEQSVRAVHAEVPVEWVEDPDSRVDIPRTAFSDLRGVLRLLRMTPTSRARLRPYKQRAQAQDVR